MFSATSTMDMVYNIIINDLDYNRLSSRGAYILYMGALPPYGFVKKAFWCTHEELSVRDALISQLMDEGLANFCERNGDEGWELTKKGWAEFEREAALLALSRE